MIRNGKESPPGMWNRDPIRGSTMTIKGPDENGLYKLVSVTDGETTVDSTIKAMAAPIKGLRPVPLSSLTALQAANRIEVLITNPSEGKNSNVF